MCDSVVVVSDDGVLFAKNSDRDTNEGQALEWHAARDHAAGSSVACTYVEIPQVAHTHATLLSRPWWMFGAEMGVNEHGVAVGNEAVYTTEPDGPAALLGMDLVRLALERATTAASAVEVIVSHLERFGQGGACSQARPSLVYHNSFLVADPREAFVLETAGRHHAVEPVAHGVRAISNGLTIDGFAERFARPTKGRVNGCATRRAVLEGSVTRDASVCGLMSALRSHGGDSPTWSPVHGSLVGTCVHAGGVVASNQTTGSIVAHLGSTPSVWATATAAPCISVFKPVRVDEPVDIGAVPTDRFDPAALWWRHERFHRRVMRDFARTVPTFACERDDVERHFVETPPSSTEAFKFVEELVDTWSDALGAVVDVRSDFVRWRAEDAARSAGLPDS